MNQKLADWASIAEIISGIAVVVTLIVLIVEVRDNTEVLRVSAYNDNERFRGLGISGLRQRSNMAIVRF